MLQVLTAEAAVQADRSDPIDAEAPERWRDEVVAAREGRTLGELVAVFLAGSKPMVPFWGFRCTTHFRTYFSGDWDVHWGYGISSHGLLRLP